MSLMKVLHRNHSQRSFLDAVFSTWISGAIVSGAIVSESGWAGEILPSSDRSLNLGFQLLIMNGSTLIDKVKCSCTWLIVFAKFPRCPC